MTTSIQWAALSPAQEAPGSLDRLISEGALAESHGLGRAENSSSRVRRGPSSLNERGGPLLHVDGAGSNLPLRGAAPAPRAGLRPLRPPFQGVARPAGPGEVKDAKEAAEVRSHPDPSGGWVEVVFRSREGRWKKLDRLESRLIVFWELIKSRILSRSSAKSYRWAGWTERSPLTRFRCGTGMGPLTPDACTCYAATP